MQLYLAIISDEQQRASHSTDDAVRRMGLCKRWVQVPPREPAPPLAALASVLLARAERSASGPRDTPLHRARRMSRRSDAVGMGHCTSRSADAGRVGEMMCACTGQWQRAAHHTPVPTASGHPFGNTSQQHVLASPSLPGRSRAGSTRSGRDVAASTATPSRASTPSSSVSS